MGNQKSKKEMQAAFEELKKRTPKGEKVFIAPPTQRDLWDCAIYLHEQLRAQRIDYYFCGGFACINVAMTARTTSDIDIVVPNGQEGFAQLLGIFEHGPFVTHEGSHYFYVEASGRFVEVDAIIGGWMNFPKLTEARIIKPGSQLQLQFLEPAGLLRLKLASWANKSRRSGPKRSGDTLDIISIRGLLIEDGKRMDLRGLTGDMLAGLRLWVAEFNDIETWQALDASFRG